MATPTLYGKDAIRFLDKMKKRDAQHRLSKTDKLLIELMHKNEKLFNV
ncbi:MAG: hypothetical protein PHH08_02815 [Candidatus ainarchaeum sp.]|nr:hypothetical protein [Candidatus ainarchaeum sp.]